MQTARNERIIPIRLEGADDIPPSDPAPSTDREPDVSPGNEGQRRVRVANVNVPEHIVICLDVCQDTNNTVFRVADGTTYTQLNMLKRVVEMFAHTKLAISARTQLALVALHDQHARLVCSFTSSAREFVQKLDGLQPEFTSAEHFPMQSLLEVAERVAGVPADSSGLLAPERVVRLILVYGRSSCVPRLPVPATPYLRALRTNPHMYADIMYAHHEDCNMHRCEEIYDALQNLDNGYSYVLQVSRNATRVHENMAKLLAHPLQRVVQKHANYNFQIDD